MKIFVVNGYSNTKMDDIADEAGFSKGAVYHHFSSKHDLFFSLIDYWETSFLPKFYSNDYSNVSLVNVLKELASEVASNFKNKKYLFLAELEIWALSNRDVKIRERTKNYIIKC
jgi:AcrR family transcriptional regulator